MDAILHGVDHPDLDRVASTAVAGDLAVALTRGRHRKQYAYVDPNEDAVGARRDGDVSALIVADGHSGHEASHTALDALLRLASPRIPTWDRHAAVRAFHEVNTAVLGVTGPLPPPHGRSRTTLVAAVVAVDDQDQRYLTCASVGDSAVFVVRGTDVHQITKDRHHFLGDRLSAPQIAGAMHYEQVDLEPDDVVVAVSDGYTNFAAVTSLADAVDGDAEATARRVLEQAGDAGAGDNVAAAVLLGTALSGAELRGSTDDRHDREPR